MSLPRKLGIEDAPQEQEKEDEGLFPTQVGEVISFSIHNAIFINMNCYDIFVSLFTLLSTELIISSSVIEKRVFVAVTKGKGEPFFALTSARALYVALACFLFGLLNWWNSAPLPDAGSIPWESTVSHCRVMEDSDPLMLSLSSPPLSFIVTQILDIVQTQLGPPPMAR